MRVHGGMLCSAAAFLAACPVEPGSAHRIPGVPQNVQVVERGDRFVMLSWSEPVDGAPADAYEVARTPGDSSATIPAPTLRYRADGLLNGTKYAFTVRALHGGNAGSPSAPVTAIPATVPGAPTLVSALRGDRSVDLAWEAPADSGGEPITGFVIEGAPGSISQPAGAGATGATIGDLSNGTAYAFRVRAVNAVGPGAASSPSEPVTPATLPGVPRTVAGQRGDGSIHLSWEAPADDGGSAVTGYVLTAMPGPIQVTIPALATSADVAELTNGVSYELTVHAVNDVGAGPESLGVVLVPATVPGAPTLVSARRGDRSVELAWEAPADSGGEPITGFVIEAAPGGIAQPVGAGATGATIENLSNGTAYVFHLRAVNAVGPGAASSPSEPVTPATVPGAPTGVTAARGDRHVVVRWVAPADDGGAAVSGFTVEVSPGGLRLVVGATPCEATVSDLQNGTAYTFTVAAANDVGLGPSSEPSASAVPATVPSEPQDVAAVRGNAQALVSWAPPLDSGGEPILGYRIRLASGELASEVTAEARDFPVTGLVNGTPYSFYVAAVNAVGEGAPSAPTPSVIPATTPGAPEDLVAVAGDLQATLSWSPPLDTGGLPVDLYEVTTAASSQTVSAQEMTLAPLKNGRTYAASVRAHNELGWGPEAFVEATAQAQPAILSVAAPPSPARACIEIPYVASRGADARVDVVVELDDGSGFRRATQAPSETLPGILRRPATPAGVSHAFFWDAFRDLGRREADVKVRVTPRASDQPSVVGAPVESAVFHVDNRGQLSTPIALATEAAVQLATGDFNRDGWPDVAWVSAAGMAYVQLANRDRTFAAPVRVDPEGGALSIAASDLQRDAKVDLVLGTNGGLTVLLGNGDGTFTAGAPLALALRAEELRIADLDADGWDDVVAAENGNQAVEAVRGLRATPTITSTDLGTPVDHLAIADLDQNARPDLVFSTSGGTAVGVALGSGDGAFGTPSARAVPGSVASLLVDEINGDGAQDVLVSLGGGGLYALLGDRTGALGTPVALWAGTAGGVLLREDLELDGQRELLSFAAAELTSLARDSAGAFAAARIYPLASDPQRVVLADLDHDGDADLVAAGSGGVTAWMNEAPRRCGRKIDGPEMLHNSVDWGNPPDHDFAIGDFNDDGKPDVAGHMYRPAGSWGNRAPAIFRVWLGRGDGTFWAEPRWTWRTEGISGFRYLNVAAADLDGDGKDEIVGVRIPTSPGETTFSSFEIRAVGSDGVFNKVGGTYLDALYDCIWAVDVDADDVKEIVLGKANALQVFMTNGLGHLVPGPRSVLPGEVCGGELIDENGDAWPDFAFSGTYLSVARGLGDGTFGPLVAISAPANPQSLSVQDVDLDGHDDLVWGSGNALLWAHRKIEGGFAPLYQLAIIPGGVLGARFSGPPGSRRAYVRTWDGDHVGTLSSSADRFVELGLFRHSSTGGRCSTAAADFDADGAEDSVISCASDARLFVWTHDQLARPLAAPFGLGVQARSLGSHDFQGDGCLDLYAVGALGFTTLRGHCDGTFDAPQTYPLPASVAATALADARRMSALADLNRDGLIDIVVPYSDEIVVFFGDRSGGFMPGVPFDSPGIWPTGIYLVDVADVDHDGFPDVVTQSAWHRGRGDGTFEPARRWWSMGYEPTDPFTRGFGDFTGDGIMDMAWGPINPTSQYGRIIAATGAGDGTFSSLRGIETLNFANQILVADVDRDGWNDFVLSEHGWQIPERGGVVWIRMAGGAPTTSEWSHGAPCLENLVLQDMDLDGFPDFVGAAQEGSAAAIFWAYPDLVSVDATHAVVGDRPRAVAVGDFDSDGLPDLAALVQNGTTVQMIRGR